MPTTNTDKSAPPALSRIDIYAAPGPPTPPPPVSLPAAAAWLPPPATHPLSLSGLPRVLLSPPAATGTASRSRTPVATTAAQIAVLKYLRGHVDVRPELPGDVPTAASAAAGPTVPPPVPDKTADPRPGPGGLATFTDTVTKARLAAATSPALSAMRYVVVGAVGGRLLGAPSPVLELPLLTDLTAPAGATVTYDEKTTTLTWMATATPQLFRVYRTDADGHEEGGPLNPTPLAATPRVAAAR